MSNAPAPELIPHRDKQAVADAAAARLVVTLVDAVAAGRAPNIGLTGGSMGSAIIDSVLRTPGHEAVDWSKVTIWWGDERYLPAGDPERNDTQNDAAGLGRLGLDPSNVYRVPGPEEVESVEEAAGRYDDAIRAHGAGEFELVLFGVGPDAHIASLFPHHPAQRVTDAIAVPVRDSPKPPPERVSLTFEAFERTRQVWFLVAGADKADAVRAGLAPDADRWDTPAAGVRGQVATLWLVDAAAAGLSE